MNEYDNKVLEDGLQFFSTIDHFYGDPAFIMNKADGSLISSYLDRDQCVNLKSKTSVGSDHAVLAMQLMNDNIDLYDFILDCEVRGYTVNLELVSPDPKFRVVLHYPEPMLIVLNVRHRIDGTYMDSNSIPAELFTGTVGADALDHLDTDTNLEGYVCIDDKGNWWKEKGAWYLERHRAKDFINNRTAFTLLVLNNEADDMVSLMADQPEILAEMKELQHRIISKANSIINKVSAYYNENKDLSRKDYAIKGKNELSWVEFPLAMQYFSGSEPNWGEFLVNQVKKIDWDE